MRKTLWIVLLVALGFLAPWVWPLLTAKCPPAFANRIITKRIPDQPF